MLSFPGMEDAMQLFMLPMSNPYASIIGDYVECCMLQDTPDHKIFYEAIVIAVNEGTVRTS
jgi:hypothetical protein